MNAKEALARKAPSRYWPHSRRGAKPAVDELLRAKRFEAERATLSLTGQLMGDPPRSRQLWRQGGKGT